MSDDDIVEFINGRLKQEKELVDIAKELVEEAIDLGSTDNVSVIIIKLDKKFQKLITKSAQLEAKETKQGKDKRQSSSVDDSEEHETSWKKSSGWWKKDYHSPKKSDKNKVTTPPPPTTSTIPQSTEAKITKETELTTSSQTTTKTENSVPVISIISGQQTTSHSTKEGGKKRAELDSSKDKRSTSNDRKSTKAHKSSEKTRHNSGGKPSRKRNDSCESNSNKSTES
eukprot:TRINITY_DN2259_c0_g1_i1.p2 TRINITY_DN2259_c0_g1~~TRINITY_DN2259_c0_g1_i1.p2  ORF type:complete len:227 (+),score=51.93 TRINITY_DN2259_c0_g1_i1:856-1536(+)